MRLNSWTEFVFLIFISDESIPVTKGELNYFFLLIRLIFFTHMPVSYTHLTLPTTPYV